MNSICTTKGGSHVNYVTDQVVNHVMDWIKNNKKKEVKSAGVKNFHVKNHLWVFVNALVDNPAFDSQTKETLTTRQAQFGSTCHLPDKVLKSGEGNKAAGGPAGSMFWRDLLWDRIEGKSGILKLFLLF